MKQIKFRAMLSDKYYAHPRMVPWGELLESFDALHIFDEDCMTLMQFTGLYDKNGREIYEGDVVRVQETMDGGRIVCLEAIATAVWNEERGCWGCEGEFSGHLADYALGTMLSLTGNCCEIIGNVYENPELLEAAEHER